MKHPKVTDPSHNISANKKALKLNLDESIYGSFAEIGAGQEVVRFFFRVGGASGTIANAMSAYDKAFSDAKYGSEASGRYVCQSRLTKMLDFEHNLIETRLAKLEQHENKRFFAFANTVATINYYKTFKGHGWLGVRFQLKHNGPINEFVIHIRLHDNDAQRQQEAIGILGVNMIYACYNLYDNPKEMVTSLYNELDRDRIEIDMVKLKGEDFKEVDNRLLSLSLVKNGMTEAVIFGPDGNSLDPGDLLYKKNILTLRGRFRPVTKVNIDMIKKGYQSFLKENKVEKDNVTVLFEMTLNNLNTDGDVNEQDFIDRAEILCSLGQTVLISTYSKYYKLVEYLSRFTSKRMGLIMGVHNLKDILNSKYYRNLKGGILEACGILFNRDLKVYMYPFFNKDKEEIINSKNIDIHPRIKPLFEYLKFNGRIVDLKDVDDKLLSIFSDDVIAAIKNNEKGWEEKVPTYVDKIIKENQLFGCKTKVKGTSKTKTELLKSF